MAECVKVIVRCRPMNTREKDLNCKCVIKMDGAKGMCTIVNPNDTKAPPKMFTFDGAFFTDSTTEAIYNDIAYPLVEGVTEGYNGTIFAYGQTGCGKSFSMQGITDPPTQRGIIPRAFDHIFETVSVAEGCKFLIHAAYLEIYNEEIRDLLGKDAKAKLDLKEHPEKGVYVSGLSMHPVHNVTECERVMERGWKNRAVGATLMNADSSRSHSIFTIYMEMITTDEEGEEHIRVGKLNLVDLAGSERQAKTGATGDRLKEATKINLSLSALGNVISALVDGKSKHIPYRDSKLTRLLQDSLGGNTKTMMVACLSPADNNYEETLSTLRYANRAKNIKNKPKINEDPKDALLRQYQEEIAKLKAMLMGQLPVPKGGFDLENLGGLCQWELEEEKERLRQEYEETVQVMQSEMEAERTNRDKLQQDMDKLRAFYDTKLRNVDGQLADLPSTAADAEKLKASRERNAKTETMAAPGGANAVSGGAGEPGPEPISSEDSTLTGPEIAKEKEGETVAHKEKGDESEAGLPVPSETVKEKSDEKAEDKWAEKIPIDIGKAEITDLAQPLIQGADGLPVVQREAGELASMMEEAEAGAEGTPTTPRATPTNLPEGVQLQQQEALKRLQALQQQMVGGENLDNTELKELHTRRKKHAEDQRKRQLIRANRKMDDDGIMVSIYDEIQEELKDSTDTIMEKDLQIKSLEREIIDIQSEFEFDRVDYLDTIRKQERHIMLLDAIIARIQPCLRRDCNYYNIDRIRTECKWNEEEERWVLPKMIIDKTSLPTTATGTILPSARVRGSPSMNGDMNGSPTPDDFSDEKLRERLRRSEDMSNTYFQTKRQSQLVGEPINRTNMKEVRETFGITPQQPMTNGFHNDDVSKGLRAAQVHGQLMNDEPIRRPMRLDALPAVNAGGKKSKKKRGGLDPL
ncbi:hypothetical protein BaRGS_00028333 [Batillaria attramentaria]|uniref:Kinesin-like protein n=1 Tax=Batillaria attramentaria TaxID=370345 RepID=A0ABD0K018_9CAEN